MRLTKTSKAIIASMPVRSLAALVTVGLIVSACGTAGDGDNAIDEEVPRTTEGATGGLADTESDAAEEPAADDEIADGLADEVTEPFRPFAELATDPTDPGARPQLSWNAVEGAATYELVVLDADGTPYWAWTGGETSVVFGGVDDPDAVGAWVFEALTWTVQARSEDGQTLAVSSAAALQP